MQEKNKKGFLSGYTRKEKKNFKFIALLLSMRTEIWIGKLLLKI